MFVCVTFLDALSCKAFCSKMSDVLFHSSCHRCCVGGDDKHANVDIGLLESHLWSHFHFSFIIVIITSSITLFLYWPKKTF